MVDNLPELSKQTQTALDKAQILAGESGKRQVSTSCFLLAVAELYPEAVQLVIPDIKLSEIIKDCKRLLRIRGQSMDSTKFPKLELSSDLQKAIKYTATQGPVEILNEIINGNNTCPTNEARFVLRRIDPVKYPVPRWK